MNHVMSERRRRAKLNERFLTLRSMVPSISKVMYNLVMEFIYFLSRPVSFTENNF